MYVHHELRSSLDHTTTYQLSKDKNCEIYGKLGIMTRKQNFKMISYENYDK